MFVQLPSTLLDHPNGPCIVVITDHEHPGDDQSLPQDFGREPAAAKRGQHAIADVPTMSEQPWVARTACSSSVCSGRSRIFRPSAATVVKKIILPSQELP